jgi:hypothetical protein
MFAEPELAELITAQVDTVADVELIIGSTAAPVQQQARAVADVLRRAVKPRSRFLAEYAAALLAAGARFRERRADPSPGRDGQSAAR